MRNRGGVPLPEAVQSMQQASDRRARGVGYCRRCEQERDVALFGVQQTRKGPRRQQICLQCWPDYRAEVAATRAAAAERERIAQRERMRDRRTRKSQPPSPDQAHE